MSTSSEIKEIVANARIARDGMLETDRKLDEGIIAIDEIAWSRELRASERSERARLRAAQTACRAAQIELSFVTIQALDQSQEVNRLINAIGAANKDVKEALEKVKNIVKITQGIAKVTAALEKVAIGLAGLVA